MLIFRGRGRGLRPSVPAGRSRADVGGPVWDDSTLIRPVCISHPQRFSVHLRKQSVSRTTAAITLLPAGLLMRPRSRLSIEPTSAAPPSPWQSVRSAARPPPPARVLLSSPRTASAAPGDQELHPPPGWFPRATGKKRIQDVQPSFPANSAHTVKTVVKR